MAYILGGQTESKFYDEIAEIFQRILTDVLEDLVIIKEVEVEVEVTREVVIVVTETLESRSVISENAVTPTLTSTSTTISPKSTSENRTPIPTGTSVPTLENINPLLYEFVTIDPFELTPREDSFVIDVSWSLSRELLLNETFAITFNSVGNPAQSMVWTKEKMFSRLFFFNEYPTGEYILSVHIVDETASGQNLYVATTTNSKIVSIQSPDN